MKVVFLCKRYYTNKDLLLDRFGRLFHLPVELVRLGLSVSVVALDYRHSHFHQEEIDGVEFSIVPATLIKLPRLLGTLNSMIGNMNPDVVVASGDSHIGYFASRITHKLNAGFAFDVYDYYPVFAGNRIPGMRTMFEKSVRHADLVLCASSPLMARLSGSAKSVTLIENGVDRQVFAPQDKTWARDKLGLQRDAPLVGYFGSISASRGPLLFEAVRDLVGQFPGIRVLLAGKIQGVSVEDPLIMYLGEVAQSAIPSLIAACDVVTVPYARDGFNDMAGPCKIAEYLACGRPIVATRVAGHESWFTDAPGSLCEPDRRDIACALARQLRQPAVARFPYRLEWKFIAGELQQALQRNVVQRASEFDS